jgi:hypothetical protein
MLKLSRRALVSSVAALPALAVPAVASTVDDPIFTKIKAARAAWDAYGATCRREPVTATGELASDTDQYARWRDEESAVGDEFEEALADMLATTPTTRQGAAELIKCLLKTERDLLDDRVVALIEHLQVFLLAAA